MVVAQKITKEYPKSVDVAIRYYRVLSVLNNIELTDREVQLLGHTAIRGNIASVTSKEEFIKKFGSSMATVNNLICKLSKLGLLNKTDNRIEVQRGINLDFSKELVLQLSLKHSGE